MKKLVILTVIAIMAVALTYAGARRTRTGPARTPIVAPVSSQQRDVSEADTIVAPADSLIRLSGYDKTLRANRESFFVTNELPDSVTVIELCLTFDYMDLSGRQLHRLTRTVKCDVPSGQTRNLSVPSWDKQHTFYYYMSPAPRRVQATPYMVRSTVERVVVIESE